MLQQTLFSEGNNQFENGEFSSQEWSAPYVVSPAIITDMIMSCRLEGRQIKRLKMIGLAYNLRREWLEEGAYNALENLDEDKRQELSNYENIDPKMEYVRFAEIDEPFLVEFEDGDVFEIDTPQQPEFRFSMNCIPWDISAGTNLPNAEANVLFSPAIGRKVISVEVKTYVTDVDPMFFSSFDEDHTSKELVSRIILWLEGDIWICIEGWIDFCHITLVDKTEDILPICFEELKPALFNWEDLNDTK